MEFSLIVCTYMRPEPLLNLLNSVKGQTRYPNKVLIIDGSINDETENMLSLNSFKNLDYYKVDATNRGLTKQRNFGVNLVEDSMGVISFLDDDTELEKNYFEEIMKVFETNDSAVGVAGVSVNENAWFKTDNGSKLNSKIYYKLGGFAVKEGTRNIVRNYLGLQSPLYPGIMPNFSHVRTCGYPLNGDKHSVDLLIGMSFNFRRALFNNIRFSTYFEGYGLYEDADFSLRALFYGENIVNTAARLNHYHNQSGRPNKYNYGKMVIRNGWYVWRVKFPKPSLKARFKWHATAFLLTIIRFTNSVTTNKRKEALTESFGRMIGWCSLIFNKPQVER